jgi:hypothetical protein
MSLLSELNAIIENLGLPVETGVFSGVAPEAYCVLTPLTEDFPVFGDDKPLLNTQEVRVSLFTRSNYAKLVLALTQIILHSDITITGRRYVAYEADSGYHHYALDCANTYTWEG